MIHLLAPLDLTCLPAFLRRGAEMPTDPEPYVVLAEDDDVLRRPVARALRDAGVKVAEARDGVELLEVVGAAARLPGLVIADVHMPRLDGLEALDLLRSMGSPVRSIVVTGSAVDASATEGVLHVLAKPYDVADLLALVQGELAAARAAAPTPKREKRALRRGRPILALAALLGLAASAPAAALAGVEALEGGRARFTLRSPGAKSVHLAGTFNGWKAGEAAWALADADGDGTFEGTFELPAGKQLYKFVVDGSTWLADPDNAVKEADASGNENSVFEPGQQLRVPTGGGSAAAPFGSTQERPATFEAEVFLLDPSTRKLPDFSTLKPTGKVFAETLDIAPRKFSDGFPGLTDRFEWFAIRYRGVFVAEKSGVHLFKLLSDDGSKLYLDGHLAIDNDGLHEPKEVVQRVRLEKGNHPMVIEYMQGPALEVALRLLVHRPDKTEEELVRVASPPRQTGGKK